jgi:hypothetical protein
MHQYLVTYGTNGRYTRIAALSPGALRDILTFFCTRCRLEYGCLYVNRLTAGNKKGTQTARVPELVSLAVVAPGVWHNAMTSF